VEELRRPSQCQCMCASGEGGVGSGSDFLGGND
jgi:hypothetical protein